MTDPHPDQRIEEAAREIRGASPIATVDNVWLRPILKRLYDDGKKAGMEEEREWWRAALAAYRDKA